MYVHNMYINTACHQYRVCFLCCTYVFVHNFTMSEFYEAQTKIKQNYRLPRTIDSRQEIFSNSDARDRHRKLYLFRDMIGASVNLALRDKSCCMDTSFLNRFLYAKKFDCEAALDLLIKYLLYKENNKHILQKLSIFDENIQTSLRDGNPSVLKQRDRKGRKVLTFAAANWDTNKYSMEDVFRALLLSFDKLLENVENQALGFVVIVDWTNFTYKQSTHISAKTLKLMIEGLQDCMPVKFKGIHFIGQPWYVDVVLRVIKPFLNEKIKRRLLVHGTNLTTLHSMVSKDILPPDLGGEGPAINTLDWYHYLLESSQNCESRKSYRLIEATVYSKTADWHKQDSGCEAKKIESNETLIENINQIS
ncbi:PREDICTED: clavesin-2-like isoform X1 [Rhagoletis zephyria]|uniref:clavesin-2-like isoform X1 n=2 Tax=Rhagoletis zephyria TaxID=28612 RepID=UPI0008114F4A|nr:PREDICTED: clavesin-2-like isoform X1 [Rhagoletis zephyria]